MACRSLLISDESEDLRIGGLGGAPSAKLRCGWTGAATVFLHFVVLSKHDSHRHGGGDSILLWPALSSTRFDDAVPFRISGCLECHDSVAETSGRRGLSTTRTIFVA